MAKTSPYRFILGSASPRRLTLLAKIGITPDNVIPADIDETPIKKEIPRDYVERIAFEKNKALQSHQDGQTYILTADTTVAVGRRIVGKPESADEAHKMLAFLSGRSQRVITSVVLQKPDGSYLKKTSTSRLKFKYLSTDELEAYIAQKEWQGRAGAYGIDGLGEAFIKKIVGSHSGIAGLPLYETRNLLLGSGYLAV